MTAERRSWRDRAARGRCDRSSSASPRRRGDQRTTESKWLTNYERPTKLLVVRVTAGGDVAPAPQALTSSPTTTPTTGRPTPGSESVMASHRSPLSRSWNRLLVGAAAGSLVLAAAGCSSGGSGADTASAEGDLTAAQQECVDKATQYIDDRGLLP